MLQGFVHPALAFGVALAVVPIAIHLLNRQRHKPLRWAAMRFVQAAYKKTRRRVQLENLLLLLLRAGAIALLALAVARPFASDASPLASLTEDRRDLVLVLDASASTGYREEVRTVYESIVERAEELVRRLDAGRGDRVRLVLAAQHPRLLSWTSPEKALSVLATLERPTDEVLDLGAALAEVRSFVEKDTSGTAQSALEIRLLSDLQASAFETPVPEPEGPGGETDEPEDAAADDNADDEADDAADDAAGDEAGDDRGVFLAELDRLEALGARVLVEDHGPAPAVPANLTVAAIEPLGPIAGAGLPLEIAVRIANHGPSPRPAERVALAVDGERLPSQRVDVPARGEAEALFAVQFADSGPHTLSASLDGDPLAFDDQRPHVIDVPTAIRVLVVNGARATRIEEDETGFLMAVLEPPDDSSLPGAGALSPFDPLEVTPEVLAGSELDLSTFDVIVLANVAAPTFTDALVARLEESVGQGASVLFTAGDRLGEGGRESGYGERLFRADGSGLLPADIGARARVASPREQYWRVASFEETHPALAFFAEDRWKPLLTEVPVFEFLSVHPLDDARVLARLDDDAHSPLLVERPWAEGRVFLWTTTIDRDWTRLPDSPRTLVPFVHELLRYAGREEGPPRNVGPSAPVRFEVASFPRAVELVRPDGSRRVLDGEPEEARGGRWRLPEVSGSDTEHAGLYALELEGAPSQPFAVQFDPAEGDLARIAPAEVSALHPALVALERGREDAREQAGAGPRQGEIWRWLALAALAALVAESLFGAWLGKRRGGVR